MIELAGQKAELHFTVQITRAATGKTETVQLVGVIDADQLEQLKQQEQHHGGDTQHGGA